MTSTSTDRRFGVNAGMAVKVPCRSTTTANITLSGEQTIDGVAVETGDRVLVKNQTTGADNGIYVVDTGTWTRSPDFNGSFDCVKGTVLHIVEGTTYGGDWFELSTSDPVIGTTSLVFTATLLGDASTVSFTQSGTSAVTRTAQDKMRDIVSVADFGANSSATAAVNVAGIQAAINAHNNVFLEDEAYSVNATITLKGDFIGKGKLGKRSRLVPTTDTFSVLINDPTQALSKFRITDLDIDFATATGSGTTISTNAAAVGINFTTTGGFYPYEWFMENVIVRNAYVGFSDTSASYMSHLRGCRAEYCRTGFSKLLGTTMVFENCFASSCKKGYRIDGTYCAILIGCANDNTVQDGTFNNVVEFANCQSLQIIGFVAELNTINVNFGSFFNINACRCFNWFGYRGNTNTIATTGGGETYYIQVLGNSRGTLKGVVVGPSSLDVSSGTGSPQGLVVAAGSTVTVEGCDINDLVGSSGSLFSYVNAGTMFSRATTHGTVFSSGKLIDEDLASLSGDVGDAAVTLTAGKSNPVQYFNTPLTVDRAVTLSTTGAFTGAKFEIVRTLSAVGGGALSVGTGPLITMPPGSRCEVTYSGTAWFVSGKSYLQ